MVHCTPAYCQTLVVQMSTIMAMLPESAGPCLILCNTFDNKLLVNDSIICYLLLLHSYSFRFITNMAYDGLCNAVIDQSFLLHMFRDLTFDGIMMKLLPISESSIIRKEKHGQFHEHLLKLFKLAISRSPILMSAYVKVCMFTSNFP